MSNFTFLQSTWPSIYREAHEAETLTFTSPKACAIICRSAMEKTIHWLYENDAELEMPYDTRLSALMHEQCFKDILKPSMFREIDLIRRFGNNAAHGNSIRKEEALVAIKNLFRFLSFLAVYYAEEEPVILPFNEGKLPTGEEKKESLEELKRLERQLEIRNEQAAAERKQLAEQAEIIESLKQQLLEQQAEVTARKAEREKVVDVETVIPELVSEAETRKYYIDQSLKEAGWTNLRQDYELEYEVEGMPKSTNPSGIGYADYVLWGDNGKPIAVIEAKKTLHDARKGKHQATLYADCLEKMHGQRPLIFYTNGFENFLWDDTFYPDRPVHGFFTKDELQLLIDRRRSRKDLRTFKVNEDIAGRYYQLEAIKRVAEQFAKTNDLGQLAGGGRRALLVMATGSGKTRTSAAIVDMLTKCDWAKRILFLADRNALVTQAKNAFGEYLSHLSSIDLTKEKEDLGTRLVFSTYPTIMNKIDGVRTEDERFYSPGHFDLIIIDEAHRSIYQKYGAIFDYFDALLVGLTATPKKEIDRNTYSLFEIEDDDPTFAYELKQAVKDGFLVPPKAMSVPIKFIREGIKYSELSDREKEEYEEKFGDPTLEEAPEAIDGKALNSWLFNTNTVDQVLNHLMTNGIKVEGGDKLGKTIIFAKNHDHAEFIEERFNKNYPEYAGNFLRIIDSHNDKAQDLLDKFTFDKEELNPQIAVSVDMMDTGVDAPRVVNLVFFKLVRSNAKFWQMIGRGTRLRPNLFAPGEDKEYFVIFDFCQNLEFFEANPEGISGSAVKSLTQRIFELKLEVVVWLRQKVTPTEAEQEIEQKYTEELHKSVAALKRERFVVKMNRRQVEDFSREEKWQDLSQGDVIDIKKHLAPLMLPAKEDHELARRFDVLLLNIQLCMLEGKDGSAYAERVSISAKSLSKKKNVPQIANHMELLLEVQTPQFWAMANIKRLEEVRTSLRDLMKFLDRDNKVTVYTQFQDDLNAQKVEEKPLLKWSTQLQSYKDRVAAYIRKNKHHVTIQKLRSNVAITTAELQELERMLFDDGECGSQEEYRKEYGDQPLGKFVRSIVGLDIQAANAAFAEFLQAGNLRADQMTFINNIITYLEKNGSIDPGKLFESPFTDVNDQGLTGVFDSAEATKVVKILDRIDRNAGVA